MTERNEEYQTHHEQYLKRQKELVSEELRDEHSELILDFLYDRDNDLAPSTARNYARELRFLIKHTYDSDHFISDPEILETSEWEKLIRRVSRKRDISSGTKRNTCYAVRAYIDWSSESPAEKDEIDAPTVTHEKIDIETVLSAEEVVDLIESTQNERDAALLGVAYECALRRTAVVQLDIKHLLEDPFPRIRVPQKIGVKTGLGRERPLKWSKGYVDRWLNQHPDADNPDAPLFCSIRDGRDIGERIGSHAVYTMMKRVAERSDVEKDRAHPHALRHARATAMRQSENLDKRDIETVLGWDENTPMHKRYEHTTSTQDASRTAKRMGIEVGSEEEEADITKCPRCDSDLPPKSSYCPSCTLRLSGEAPEWFKLFKMVAKDTDPLLQRYQALPSAAPKLRNLSPEELDHLRNVLSFGEANMYDIKDHASDDIPHPYDGVTAFQYEDDATAAIELVDRIGELLGAMYTNTPEQFDLIEDQVDMSNIRARAKQLQDE